MTNQTAVIVGAGPAGLTCAIYLARAGWNVEVFSGEEHTISCLAEAPMIMNYPGFPDGITGFDLLETFSEQAEKSGAKIHSETIQCIDTGDKVVVDDYNSIYHYNEVVMASGVKPRMFMCDGIEQMPVHTCAVCDGNLYGKNDILAVVGGGDTAVNSALYLSRIVKIVHVFVRKNYMRATNVIAVNELNEKPNVEIHYGSEIQSVSKNDESKSLFCLKTNNGQSFEANALFSCIGYDVNPVTVLGNGVIWKCGDCSERHQQVAIAVGSGAMAAMDIITGHRPR